jgi:glutaminyl-tRNA synthetase
MSTLAGLRRRGVPPEAIRRFVEMVGVTRAETRMDLGKLEFAIRDHLNHVAPRVLAVLDPLKVVITNLEPDHMEWLDAPYYPRDVEREGSRPVPFGRDLLVERSDFAEVPPPGWKRLAPGWEVRLRHAYTLRCDEAVRDPGTGDVTELRCTVDLDTLGRNPEGRKVAGVIHWLAADHALPAEVRLYDRLFRTPVPEDVPEGEDLAATLNPESLVVLPDARLEPSVAEDPAEMRYQFERTGYFWRDPVDSSADALVFNRIVSLRDTWSRRAASAAAVDGSADAGSGSEPSRSATAGAAASSASDRISEERAEARRAAPELAARFRRYQDELGLDVQDADVLTGSTRVSDLFEAALEAHPEPAAVAVWVVNDVMREMKALGDGQLPFDGAALGRLVRLVDEGRLSTSAARTVFQAMVEEGADPEAVVRARGLDKVTDPEVLEPLVARVVDASPDEARAFKGGKTGLLGFFIGQVMRESGGAADPEVVRRMLVRRLEMD